MAKSKTVRRYGGRARFVAGFAGGEETSICPKTLVSAFSVDPKSKSLSNPGFLFFDESKKGFGNVPSTATSRLDCSDVYLFHLHHRIESAFGDSGIVIGYRFGQSDRRNLP